MHKQEVEKMELSEAAIQLENQYADNSTQMKILHEKNRKIVLLLIEIYHGVKIGNTVIETKTGKKYIIQRFDKSGWSLYDREHKPWIYGYVIKKDGTPSTRPTCIYSEWVNYSEWVKSK